MLVVFQKELRTYFTTPMGYLLLAVYVLISSLYFVLANLSGGLADLSYVFQFQATWLLLFLPPLLTMRLLSEERRSRTDQMLLTSQASIPGIILGKYGSALCMYALCLSVNLLFFGVTLRYSGSVLAGEFLCYTIGLFLLAASVISIDLFVSALTENQLIAAFGAIGINVLLMLTKSFAAGLTGRPLAFVAGLVSVFTRFYSGPARGILSIPTLIYYGSLSALFLFFTAGMVEKRRWS